MGKVIGTYCSVARRNEYIYPKDIPGYIAPEPQVLTEDGQRFTFTYTPIEYNIEYNLNGGSFDDSIVSKQGNKQGKPAKEWMDFCPCWLENHDF